MEFKIDKNILNNALTLLSPYLEKKDNSSVASNILIKSNGLLLTMYATDYEYGLKLDVIAEDITDGEYLVNGANILNIVKRLKSAEVHLINENDILTIKQGRSKLRLNTLSSEHYPMMINKSDDMKHLIVDNESFNKGVKKCLFAVDTTNPKYELNSMLIKFDDVIKFVATDTRSLPIYKSKIQTDLKDELLISKKSITEMQKLLNEESNIYFNDNTLIIESSNSMFFTKLINGKFPDFNRVVSESFIHEFTIPKNAFVENVKLVTAIDYEILITFSQNKILIEAGEGKNKSETEIEYEFDCNGVVTMICNSNQVLNAVSNIDGDLFKFCINESNLPFAILENDYTVITMPIVRLEK